MSWLNKFPSSDFLIKSAASTFKRFPFTLLSALLGVIAAIKMVEIDSLTDWPDGIKLVMVGVLGLSLFTVLAAFAEKRKWKYQASLGFQATGLLLLVGYYFSLPPDVTNTNLPFTRFVLLSIGLHFLVAWLPYVGANQVKGFWQFNKSLFLRFFMAALYSAVMFLGLTTALAAADYLFGVDVDWRRYSQLWFICAGFLHPWLFLAGIPERLDQLSSSVDYPKTLKIFTQYILLPLVGLYFFILITYEGKIIFTWNWPKGWVSELVLWYSVVGILSMLLLYPLKERAENRWIAVFSKRYFWGLLPLVAMLFLAIFRRISDYGFTANRYFVLVMAIGLMIVVLYFIVSKVKDIRIIPIILCALAFLSAYGPLNAFSVSERSQMGRLETMLTENNLMSEGVLQENSGPLPLKTRKELSSVVEYLDTWYGEEAFTVWLDDSLLSNLDTTSLDGRNSDIARLLGFTYAFEWVSVDEESFYISPAVSRSMDIAGYDYYIEVNGLGPDEEQVLQIADSLYCHVGYGSKKSILSIGLGDFAEAKYFAELPFADTVNSLGAWTWGDSLSADQLSFDLVGDNFDGKIIFSSISGIVRPDKLDISNIRAQVLLRMHKSDR